MNTNIFICQLPQEFQNKIQKSVIRFLKFQGCYTKENLNNIMSDRFENLNNEGFTRQYNRLKKEVENMEVTRLLPNT